MKGRDCLEEGKGEKETRVTSVRWRAMGEGRGGELSQLGRGGEGRWHERLGLGSVGSVQN